MAALLGTLLANAPLSTPSAVGAFGSIAVSVVFTIAFLRRNLLEWSLPFALVDLVSAGLCVALTGGSGSAFVFYMTAPLLVPAFRHDGRMLAVLSAAAGWIYAAAVVVDGRTDNLGRIVDDVAMLMLVPTLAFGLFAVAQHPGATIAASSILGPGDLDLLRRLVRGLTYKQIADETAVSPESVKVAVARLYRRLGARTRAEAIGMARERGLLSLPSGPSGDPWAGDERS